MKTVKVIALRDHEWAGKPHKLGEMYEVDSSDVRFDALIKIGHARVAEVEQEPPESVEPQHKGRYSHREMRPRK